MVCGKHETKECGPPCTRKVADRAEVGGRGRGRDTTRQRNNTRLDCAMHETECGSPCLVAEEEDVEDEVGPSTREDDDDEEENDNEVDTVEKRGTSR